MGRRGFLVCPSVCPSLNSYLILLHFSLARCEDKPDLISKPASPMLKTEWATCHRCSSLGNMRPTEIVASEGANLFPPFFLS